VVANPSNDPLHGVTLKAIPEDLVARRRVERLYLDERHAAEGDDA
jgi:uncharacterized protein (DUF2132 family)